MKRPVLVTIIGVLAIISGIAQAAFGGLILAARNDVDLQTESTLLSSQLTVLGITLLVVGVLTVVFAIGLLKGSRLSRLLVGLMELAQIAGGVYVLAVFDSSHRPAAIGNIVGGVIVLYFLFGTEKAKAFFAH